jgi:hypothetical protein
VNAVLTRLAKLEAEFGENEFGLTEVDLEDEAARWDSVLEPAVENVGQAAIDQLAGAGDAVFLSIFLLLRAAESERPEFLPQRTRDEIAARRRWPKTIAVVLSVLPSKLRDCVLLTGLVQPKELRWLSGWDGWLSRWLEDLMHLRCRVPPGINPDAMATVVNLHLQPPADGYFAFFSVCPTCGLRLPSMVYSTTLGRYRCFMDLAKSPCCQVDHTQWWPLGRIAEKNFAWIARAEEELAF